MPGMNRKRDFTGNLPGVSYRYNGIVYMKIGMTDLNCSVHLCFLLFSIRGHMEFIKKELLSGMP